MATVPIERLEALTFVGRDAIVDQAPQLGSFILAGAEESMMARATRLVSPLSLTWSYHPETASELAAFSGEVARQRVDGPGPQLDFSSPEWRTAIAKVTCWAVPRG